MTLALQCIYGRNDEGDDNGVGEERSEISRREWKLLGLLYADDLVLCGESDEDLRSMLGRFEECRRRGLKINAGKSEVMVLNGEEGLECEVYVGGTRLEHVSEFKYSKCVLNESGTDETECSRKVARGEGSRMGWR